MSNQPTTKFEIKVTLPGECSLVMVGLLDDEPTDFRCSKPAEHSVKGKAPVGWMSLQVCDWHLEMAEKRSNFRTL